MVKTRHNRKSAVLLIVAVVLIGYGVWSRSGRSAAGPVDAGLRYTREYGSDAGVGNLIAIQPYVAPADYASEARFLAKLDAYFDLAARRGWLGRKTLIVLPEYVGSWLVVVGEKQGVYDARTTDGAMKLLLASNLFSVARHAAFSPSKDRLRYAVFRMKGRRMAEVFDDVLSALARKYRVTIAAGSIVLPSPRIEHGRLRAGGGPLYNVSPLYTPDGNCAGLVTKVFLTADEKPWLKAGKVRDLRVFHTPVGKLGLLICADSWFPESYEALKRGGADILAVVSYGTEDDARAKPWSGYSGQPTPADVRRSEVGHITLGQAWHKYAFPGRPLKCGLSNGLSVCLRGRLWDLGSDGSTVVLRDGHVTTTPSVDGAAIINAWLPRRQ